MGGGLMQLVAYGAQDVYLTGNPQITFFKVVYRRHTNFAQECIEQTFSGAVGSGKRVTATLARNGDLVKEIYLHANVETKSTETSVALEAVDFTNIVEWAEVEIGGQTIDKQYSQWMDIYNQLFETNHDYRAAVNTITLATVTEDTETDHKLFVPLRFWFNRNPGLALPLIALQYHEVKVNIQLSNEIVLNDNEARAEVGTQGQDGHIAAKVAGQDKTICNVTDASLLVNYVYLDTDERRRFAQVSHEYLIEQVQHTGSESVANGNNKVTLNYNHPVKMLAWSASAALGAAKLQLNGHDRASSQSAAYYQLLQPYESGLGHSNVMKLDRTWAGVGATSPVYMYSFALKPGEHQPSGTCNFSRIDNAVLNIAATGTATLNVFALNYNVLRIMSGMGGLAYSN